MPHKGYIYILASSNNRVLYIGVTSNLERRIFQHKTKEKPGSFTAKYRVSKLIYYEEYDTISDAIDREKYLKGKKREYKEKLINSVNPDWKDFYE